MEIDEETKKIIEQNKETGLHFISQIENIWVSNHYRPIELVFYIDEKGKLFLLASARIVTGEKLEALANLQIQEEEVMQLKKKGKDNKKPYFG